MSPRYASGSRGLALGAVLVALVGCQAPAPAAAPTSAAVSAATSAPKPTTASAAPSPSPAVSASPSASASAVAKPAASPAASPAAAVSPVASPSPAAAGAPSGQPIKVGASAPLSGPNAFAGNDWMQGLTLSVDQINAAGGVLGRPLQIISADNECSPDGAVSAARKLIDLDQVDVILGGVCSGATLGGMPVIQQAPIVQLTDVSSNPTITANAGTAGGNIWEFRINADDSIISTTYSKNIASVAKTVVIFAENDDFGHGAVDAYNVSLPAAGAQIQSVEYFAPGQADYRASLAKVQTENPDALLLIMESQDAAVFVRQLNEVGFAPKLFSRGSIVTPEFLDAIKDQPQLGEGIEEASLWAVGEDPAFDAAFQQRFGRLPPANGSGPYYSAKVLAEAIRIAGKVDRASIRDGLSRVDLQLPWGHVKFDDHNQAHPNITLSVIKDGKIQLLSVLPTE